MDRPHPPQILTFNTPPSWPTPSEDWQRQYAGWRPAASWVPAGSAAAPSGWEYWSPGPGWTAFEGAAMRRVRKQLLRHALVLFAGIVITYATWQAAANGGTYVVCWGAIVFGLFGTLRSLRRVRAADRYLLGLLHKRADTRFKASAAAR